MGGRHSDVREFLGKGAWWVGSNSDDAFFLLRTTSKLYTSFCATLGTPRTPLTLDLIQLRVFLHGGRVFAGAGESSVHPPGLTMPAVRSRDKQLARGCSPCASSP